MDRFPGITMADEAAEAAIEAAIDEALDELTLAVRDFCFLGLLDHETAELVAQAEPREIRDAIIAGLME